MCLLIEYPPEKRVLAESTTLPAWMILAWIYVKLGCEKTCALQATLYRPEASLLFGQLWDENRCFIL